MRYVLGIDQGGTKTHALVGDELGHILGAGCDEGSCHSVNGMDHAMRAAGSAARMALERAHIAADDLAAVAAGMTGVDWPEEAGLLKGALSRTLGVDRAKIHVDTRCQRLHHRAARGHGQPQGLRAVRRHRPELRRA